MTIGQKIKNVRIKSGMTQAKLAEILGIPYQSIGQWERGLRNPKYDTLQKIADALNIDLNDLIESDPLPDKKINLRDDGTTVILDSNSQEFLAFSSFLEELGYSTKLDLSLLNGSDANQKAWIVIDQKTGNRYLTCTKELDDLLKSVINYTKFQVFELLQRAQKNSK